MASGQRRSSPAPERPPGWPAGEQLQVGSQGDSSSYRSPVRGTQAVTGLAGGVDRSWSSESEGLMLEWGVKGTQIGVVILGGLKLELGVKRD